MATELGARLVAIDPANANSYRQRLADFNQRWGAAIGEWQQRAAPLKGARIVVHHNAWPYLFAWLGLERAATLEPKPGVPPTPGHLAELKQRLQRDPARMIIRTPYASARPSKWLAEQTDMPAVVLPFTVGGSPAADDLFGLFDDTLKRLLDNAQP